MSIPVLIVPVLNRPDLLDKMLASIDHPVERLIIIDNGDLIDAYEFTFHSEDTDLTVIQPGWNLGVGASWNLGFKCSPLAPWWLVVNSDIEFGPGDLAALDETVNPGAAALYEMSSLACYAVTYHALRAVGLFDENIHPAYDEDVDWGYRARQAGIVWSSSQFTGSHAGSSTIGSDPAYSARNGVTHGTNDRYYAAKWGGEKQGGETFTTPFDQGGHVGDWRLDIERLRTQAWRKP